MALDPDLQIRYVPTTRLDWILAREIDHHKPMVIVQFGSDILTPYFLGVCHPQTKFIIFEQDPEKYKKVKRLLGSKVEIIRNDITSLDLIMNHYEVGKIDIIISRFQLSLLPKSVRNQILNTCANWLGGEGKMIQLQHVDWSVKKSFNSIFKHIKVFWMWENIFPQMGLIAN